MEKIAQYKHLAFIILPLMYLAGIIGLNLPQTKELFKILIPFNLLVSLAALLWYHTDWNKAFVLYAISAFLIGFFIEILGVQTGIIFGHYHYGTVLGWGIWGVPLTIGCNWLMLNYFVNVIANQLTKNTILKILLAATLMTTLDFLIEPAAIELGFWHWQNNIIPTQNYIAWFLVSALISSIYFLLDFSRSNALAMLLFVLQASFFIVINIILMLK